MILRWLHRIVANALGRQVAVAMPNTLVGMAIFGLLIISRQRKLSASKLSRQVERESRQRRRSQGLPLPISADSLKAVVAQ